jgi:hypothetical protein
VEPVGTRRLPDTDQLDVRFEKTVSVVGSQKVALQVNAFNVLNTNTVIDVVRQSGPRFLRPTEIMLPRILEFGLRYSF